MRTLPLTVIKRSLLRTVLSNGTTSLVGNYNAFEDKITPSAIIKGNHTSPNPWSYTIRNTSRLAGWAYDRQGSYGGPSQPLYSKFDGPLQGMLVPDVTTLSKADVAYNKALDKLNDKVRGGLDISVAMAECSATFRMTRALSKAKRYFSGIGSKRWANEWLELQYGWLPLLSDIYGAAEEIQRVNLGYMRFKGRGSNLEDTSKTLTTSAYVDISGISNYTDLPVKTKSKIKVYNSCEFEIVLKPPTSLQELARWTSLNPLSIAWELTPYSFVFDWFFDVGSYLRNVETSITYNSAFSSGYRSELYVGEHRSQVSYFDGVQNYFTRVVQIEAEGNDKLKQFSRTVLISYPLPRIPRVNTDLSAKRLLSAAALLRQMLKF